MNILQTDKSDRLKSMAPTGNQPEQYTSIEDVRDMLEESLEE